MPNVIPLRRQANMPTPSVPPPANDDLAPSGWRTFLSLLIVIHLFLVGVSVGSNYAPAAWQLQLLSRFRFYTRLLNFDLDSTPYHLTHASEFDVDHRIEVLPANKAGDAAENWIVLPEPAFHGCDSYQRYQRLASQWALEAQNEGDPASFAQAIGTHFARQRSVVPKQIRCRRHFLQSQEEVTSGTGARRNPDDPSFFAAAYTANAIVSGEGYVEVVRVEEAGQVAQPVGNSPGTRGQRQ